MSRLLEARPIRLKDARRFVNYWHRHNRAPAGGLFALSVWRIDNDELVGVGIAGRPIARALDNGKTIEITRTCTKGNPNANSMLYRGLSRAAFALGWSKVISYNLKTESGASLRAAGFTPEAETTPHSWNSPARSRRELPIYTVPKVRWSKSAVAAELRKDDVA